MMNKTLKIVVSIVLIIAILCSPALAYSADADEGLKYVSLGDSIAGGIGLPDNPLRGPEQPDKTKVFCYKTAGSYPVLIAEALGVSDENFAQLACAGMRTVELRACIDPSYTVPDNYANNFRNNELQTWVKDRFDFRALIQDADVITLNMCANDIASYALFYLRAELDKGIPYDSPVYSVITELESRGDYFSALVKLLELSEQIGVYKRAAEAAIRGLNVGYSRWIENWEAIIGIIYRLNPDVKLFCLGVYNPFDHIKLTKYSLIEFGTAFNSIVASMNYWTSIGSAYANRYRYVDIMGIESMCTAQRDAFTDDDFFDSFELKVHPSEKGHQQIAQKVLNKLNEQPCVVKTMVSSQVKQVVRTTVNTITSGLKRLVSIFVR